MSGTKSALYDCQLLQVTRRYRAPAIRNRSLDYWLSATRQSLTHTDRQNTDTMTKLSRQHVIWRLHTHTHTHTHTSSTTSSSSISAVIMTSLDPNWISVTAASPQHARFLRYPLCLKGDLRHFRGGRRSTLVVAFHSQDKTSYYCSTVTLNLGIEWSKTGSINLLSDHRIIWSGSASAYW